MVFPADAGMKGHFCMVYNSFLDDSKDQRQTDFLVSAGFVGTIQDWRPVRVAWSSRLKANGMAYFKTSEYKMLKGEFSQFRKYASPTGRDKAKNVRTDLIGILRQFPEIQGIGVSVALDDYRKVCARPEASGILVGKPYHRALEGVFLETVKYVRSLPGENNVVAFIHDDGPDFNELHDLYKSFKQKNPKTAKYMVGFQPLDDKKHPPLQAADMMANYALEIGMEWLSTGRKKTKMQEMEESIDRLKVWDEPTLLGLLKHQLKRKGKPIPADLQTI